MGQEPGEKPKPRRSTNLVYLVPLVYLVSLVRSNQTNQTDQINQMNQIDEKNKRNKRNEYGVEISEKKSRGVVGSVAGLLDDQVLGPNHAI